MFVLMQREYEYNDEGYSCPGESDEIGIPIEAFDTAAEAGAALDQALVDLVRTELPYEALAVYRDYSTTEWTIKDLVEVLGSEYVVIEQKERVIYGTINGRHQKTGETEPYEILKKVLPVPNADIKMANKLFRLLNYRPYFIVETKR